ncbi:hypothetical protein A5N82_10420 [Christensenella minuta]|uniref:Uncharacterized protein n=1 Tax=Christensenella minuta TaxID=626937 RepID=A0A136Q6P4_9FIRM|nr:hypothetical protein B1H56_14015 [Christensenella minuta]KXK66355.1 hypothetical protein HMPREF3293_00760 [Christensenella minuta]OAQ41434.1 hypothetical protein A5N82_10420 [Christensenella minuta]
MRCGRAGNGPAFPAGKGKPLRQGKIACVKLKNALTNKIGTCVCLSRAAGETRGKAVSKLKL